MSVEEYHCIFFEPSGGYCLYVFTSLVVFCEPSERVRMQMTGEQRNYTITCLILREFLSNVDCTFSEILAFHRFGHFCLIKWNKEPVLQRTNIVRCCMNSFHALFVSFSAELDNKIRYFCFIWPELTIWEYKPISDVTLFESFISHERPDQILANDTSGLKMGEQGLYTSNIENLPQLNREKTMLTILGYLCRKVYSNYNRLLTHKLAFMTEQKEHLCN